MNERDVQINRLSELITRNCVIPFIGAGMSATYYPLWKDYIKSIPMEGDHEVIKCVDEYLEVGQYEDAAQLLEKEYGIAFYNKTQIIFDKGKIGEALTDDAVSLLPYLFRGPIFTTNIDKVLEHVYGNDIEVVEDADKARAYLVSNEMFLWKLHGDIRYRSSWVLTKDNYYRLYGGGNKDSKDNKFVSTLLGALGERSFLFLGCSLESDKIVNMLERVFSKNINVTHYAVLESPGEEETRIQRVKQLGKMGVVPIWFPHGQFGEIKTIIEEIIAKVGMRYEPKDYIPNTVKIRPAPNYIKKKATSYMTR